MKCWPVLFLFSLFVQLPGQLWAQDNTYPTDSRLFHIERSKNKNLVCYDANLANGKLDTGKPLKIYWVDREDSPGTTKDLNAMQRTMAYGYKLVSKGEDTADVTLTAYADRKLTIRKLNGKYTCLITINNQPAILHHLYVKAKESNSLSVEYVELFGTAIDSQQAISERIRK